MIATLRGKLLQKQASAIVVECTGVGYELMLPYRALQSLPVEGEEVFLYVHTYLKDNTLELYGFTEEEEKKVFRLLLSVKGIGPKLALNILSESSPEDFYRAVESGDITLLSRLPGIGRKTASRIIFELKQTLPSLVEKDETYEDVLSALINLGYKKAVAKKALDRVYSPGIELESLIKDALRELNREGGHGGKKHRSEDI